MVTVLICNYKSDTISVLETLVSESYFSVSLDSDLKF